MQSKLINTTVQLGIKKRNYKKDLKKNLWNHQIRLKTKKPYKASHLRSTKEGSSNCQAQLN